MRALAHQHGVVDDPDNKRKIHSQPIAYLGGVSIFLGWLAGVSVAVFLRAHNSESSVQIPPGVIAGAFCAVFFGLMDDVYSLSPRMKILGQLLAALALIMSPFMPGGGNTDFLFGNLSAPGAPPGPAWMILEPLARFGYLPGVEELKSMELIRIGAPLFAGLVAIVIIISTCNATNLIDGLDGLCSGVTGVMSVGYLILAAYLAHTAVGTVGGGPFDPVRISLSLALLGAVLGFLPYNFNPASIFMGDTGSMFLGYMCGTMILLFGQNGTVRWFLSAIIMFGLPMMDTLLAIVRRKLNGRKIFSPDSNHFHHFLIRRGLSVRRAVVLSYGVAAIFVSFALIIVIMPTPLALGIYLVLFGWIIVTAFKIGMIFENRPQVTANTTLNIAVIASNKQSGKSGSSDVESPDLAKSGTQKAEASAV
jgi:UDP-GlcNAc:undecaprenyl-phosphate GlcNAc-1-phosphate transferase